MPTAVSVVASLLITDVQPLLHLDALCIDQDLRVFHKHHVTRHLARLAQLLGQQVVPYGRRHVHKARRAHDHVHALLRQPAGKALPIVVLLARELYVSHLALGVGNMDAKLH